MIHSSHTSNLSLSLSHPPPPLLRRPLLPQLSLKLGVNTVEELRLFCDRGLGDAVGLKKAHLVKYGLIYIITMMTNFAHSSTVAKLASYGGLLHVYLLYQFGIILS
jgi:hypothetical protein